MVENEKDRTGLFFIGILTQPVVMARDQTQNLDDTFLYILDLLSISTWVEDFSAVKQFFDTLKAKGVEDFRAYFLSHPEDVIACAGMIKIRAINKAGLEVLHINSLADLPQHLPLHFKDELWPTFCEEIIALAEGQTTFRTEITVRALSGGDNVVDMYLSVPPMYADTLERVLISFSNLTERKQIEAALRISEERNRALFERAPIGIVVAREGRILYANQAFAGMNGFAQPAELTGTLMIDRIAPEAWEQVSHLGEDWEQTLVEIPHYEISARRQDGSLYFVEAEFTSLALEDGPALMIFAQDITARKRAEEAEREQRHLAEALRDIAAALNRTLDYDQILDTILENMGRILTNDLVNILWIINEKNEAYIVRERGYQAEESPGSPSGRVMVMAAEVPVLARMLRTGQPVVVPDAGSDPDWVAFENLDWVRSYAGIPVRASGEVIGFINLCSMKPNFYRPEYAERLEAMADQMAIAFTNASLVYEQRQANERLQSQLAEIQLLQSELREQAIRDPLTGLVNRRYLLETLPREIERARRDHWPVSIILIDIDHFKALNDANGHKAGDLVLQNLGGLLKNSVRAGDIACRYGGEEFVIVLPNVYPLVAFDRAEQIRLLFAGEFYLV